MSDPAFKVYTDAHFVTKASLKRQLEATVRGVGQGIGPYVERIAALEATVKALEAKLEGIRTPGRARP